MSWEKRWEKFQRTSNAEKIWLLLNTACLRSIEKCSKKAVDEASRRFAEETLLGGTGDAFRHCYWSALLTREIGFIKAKSFTDAHEDAPGNDPLHKEMDLHNNWQGIEIAIKCGSVSDSVLIAHSLVALANGKLKTIN